MSDELLSQAEIEALLAGVNNPVKKDKAPTPGPKFDAEEVKNNIEKYFKNNDNEIPGEESLNNLDQLRGLLGLQSEYTDEDIIAADKIAQEEINKIVASDDKARENKEKLSAFITSAANKLSEQIMNSNNQKTDVLNGDNATKAEVVENAIPPVIETGEEGRQDAGSDKNEAQEFFDSQMDLITSGEFFIDVLVTRGSDDLPQFDNGFVVSKLFGNSYTDKNQIKALKDYYKDYVLNKYLKDEDGKELSTAVRARTISLQLSDAQREAESYLDEKKEQLPTTVTGEPGEQDASPGKNETQEFLDSQKELIASGEAYINSLVTQESAILPQFDKADVISQLFGEKYTDKNQIRALKNYYEDNVLKKYVKGPDGEDLPTAVRAGRVSLKLYDAQRGAENYLDEKKEQLPTTVTGESGEQDASPAKNETQEFLDSQEGLTASGKAYIDSLITDESAPIPPFDDSTFRSELFGDACTKQSQVKALENYYEKLLTEKEKQIEDGQSNAKGDRVRSVKSRLYDAANAVEDQVNAGQERPLSEADLQKGIKENFVLYMRDQDADVLKDPDMLKVCLLLREGFSDEDLKNHLAVLDDIIDDAIKDPKFAEKADLIKEAVAEGVVSLSSVNKGSLPQEGQPGVSDNEKENEIVVKEGTQFPDSDDDVVWVVEKIEGDKVFIRPVDIEDPDFKSKEVNLTELKERLKVIEAEKEKAESINNGLVKDYDTFRNNHNEIIDKRFENDKWKVKKTLGGFFRNSSARVAIGMIVGVSSSLALGANPLASPMVAGVRMLTRNALSVFGFGTGNKARAIGNEQARAMKTLEFGLSDDIKRPGQEEFNEEIYNQALVENYKNITPEEQAKILATLVEIADQKGQKINTDEYEKQIESIREGKKALKEKNGTLARFDEYREKFSKMSTKKKIAMSVVIAAGSITAATVVGYISGAAVGGATLLAVLKSVGLASGTIGGMLTSGAIGMASGALMSNPEKTTDYSENSALVEALGKEYFAGGGKEENLEQYYKEVNIRFNVALAKGVGVGLVFANAMTIFGLGKGALDHFRGHGANGGNEAVVGTTGKQVTSEPTGAGRSTISATPGTNAGEPSAIRTSGQIAAPDNLPKMDEHHHAINEGQFQKAEMPVNPTRTESSTNFSDELKGVEKVDAGAGASDRYAVKMFEGLEGKGQITSHSEIDRLSMIKGISHELRESGIFDAKDGHLTDAGQLEKVNPLMIAHSAMGEVNDGVTFNDINLDQAGADQIHNQIEHHVPLETTYATLANHEPIGNAVGGQQTAEAAVVGARHGIEPAVHTDVDKHVAGASSAQKEALPAQQIDKEVASKINQANIDPAGKSFEKATTLSMNQVNKIIDPNSGNKYMDGWFGSFLRRGVEHGYLKEGDLRVMIDQAGHPQMKVNLSHFPSQESTGIASNHLGIGLKGIPENAGIDSVYKDRPWWDLRSNFVKVNTEDALANKAVHGTGTPMPTPEGHQKVDITPEIKQNSTDGVIRFKAEDVDPTTKTDFPNSSAGHTAPEHGTNLGNSTLNGPEIPSVQDIPLNSSALMNVDPSHNYLVNIQGQDPMSVPGTQVSQMVEEAKKYFVDHNAKFENSSQERNSIWLYVLDHLKKKE